MACGMAAECEEPIALSCTGATASRNYIPGLTEAFYRKLPILAITSTPPIGRIGHYFPQQLDRSQQLNDMVVTSVQIPIIKKGEDEWEVNTKINTALLELRHNGFGPVHINLETECNPVFDVEELPNERIIRRIVGESNQIEWPEIKYGNTAIFVGSHLRWTDKLREVVDEFCEQYNSVVLVDQTSNYSGQYGIMYNLIGNQEQHDTRFKRIGLLIDIGMVSGAYMRINPNEVWRINEDGVVRDRFQKMSYVFEMDEVSFFEHYVSMKKNEKNTSLFAGYKDKYNECYNKIDSLPFSNIWIAKQLASVIPEGSVVHLGILNSLRAWDFFERSKYVCCFSNTGGFGIDGGVSTLIGASIVSPNKLFFGVIGDLAFFYDMNSLGNRHVGKNLRLIVINNGKGTEFRNYSHNAAKFGERADDYIAAAGHYGNQSNELLAHYAQDLGLEYICVHSQEEFKQHEERFLRTEGNQSILMEVFTNSEDESNALHIINNLIVDPQVEISPVKRMVAEMVGEAGVKTIKRMLGR